MELFSQYTHTFSLPLNKKNYVEMYELANVDYMAFGYPHLGKNKQDSRGWPKSITRKAQPEGGTSSMKLAVWFW